METFFIVVIKITAALSAVILIWILADILFPKALKKPDPKNYNAEINRLLSPDDSDIDGSNMCKIEKL